MNANDRDLDRKLRRALRALRTTESQRQRYQDRLIRQEPAGGAQLGRRGLAEFGAIAAVLIVLIIGVAWWQQDPPAERGLQAAADPSTTSTPTPTATPTPPPPPTLTPTPAPAAMVETVPLTPPATCPLTRPGQQTFSAPAPYPATPPALYDALWYGTDALWTMVAAEGEIWAGLPYDGGFSEKTFWWRAGYEAQAEPQPAITVTGKRLDKPGPTFEAGGPGTHGIRTDIGDFMLVGVSIPTPGCWELTGHYDGAELSYVIWVTAAS